MSRRQRYNLRGCSEHLLKRVSKHSTTCQSCGTGGYTHTPVRATFRPGSVPLVASGAQPVCMYKRRPLKRARIDTYTPLGPLKPRTRPSQAKNRTRPVCKCILRSSKSCTYYTDQRSHSLGHGHSHSHSITVTTKIAARSRHGSITN